MTDASRPIMSKSLVDRVKAILMSPKTEWPIIAAEPATVPDLYKNYIVILSAIPAVATFIKMSLIGYSVPFMGTMRIGIGSGLTTALMTYVMSLIGIFVIALIIDFLAPRFGGVSDRVQALKAAAYGYTAYWVASVALVLPAIGMLIVLIGGLYSLYLLYLGLPVTMRTTGDKALPFTALVVVCAIVISMVFAMIVGSIAGTGAMMMGGGMGNLAASNDVRVDPASPLGQLGAFGQRMEQANKELEAAQQSGDAEAQQQALGNLLGSALGGGNANVESLAPDQMRAFVPERLAGLPRTDISVERNAMMGIQVSEARASYGDDSGRSLDLEITDMGGAQGLMAMAAWAGIEGEKQTDTGYERTSRQGTRIVHEVWDNESKRGDYEVIVGKRFMVKVSGEAGNIDALRAAAQSVDLARLEGLRAETAPR